METKTDQYNIILKQIDALVTGESNLIANLANSCAVLKETFDFWWVGFYLVEEEELVLGPFQGPVACTRIPKGKGVCGDAFELKKSICVANVHEYPGHIACSAASNSELVIPIIKNDEVVAVLDIDSLETNGFDEIDQQACNQIAQIIAERCFE